MKSGQCCGGPTRSECRQCGKPLDTATAQKVKTDRVYCSNACKQQAYRNSRNAQPVTDPSVTAVPVTDDQGGVTDTPDKRSSSAGDPQTRESGENSPMIRLDDQTMVGADGRVETTYPDGSALTLTVDPPVREDAKSGKIAVCDRTGANWGSEAGDMTYQEWVGSGLGARGEPLAQPSPIADVETDTADTSQCYRDSGIPLSGDPGYKGVCVKIDGNWMLPVRNMTRPEMQKRYANGQG